MTAFQTSEASVGKFFFCLTVQRGLSNFRKLSHREDYR
jgi:hypothetical protein